MRKLLVPFALLLTATLGLTTAVSAAPPEEVQEPLYWVLDFEEGRVGLVNITVEEYCAYGDATQPVTVRRHETGQGAVVSRIVTTRLQIEVWEGDPCAGTPSCSRPAP